MQQVNKLTSIEMLIIELGVSFQPFQESFKKYKEWVRRTWVVSIWETCDMFYIKVCLNNKFFKMPRKGDKWLMQLFVAAGFSKDSLLRLNRVRVHQQVLFLS